MGSAWRVTRDRKGRARLSRRLSKRVRISTSARLKRATPKIEHFKLFTEKKLTFMQLLTSYYVKRFKMCIRKLIKFGSLTDVQAVASVEERLTSQSGGDWALSLGITDPDRLDNDVPARLRLERHGAVIGRSPQADWTLPDPQSYISFIHCEIDYGRGAYVLTDKSTNGVFINGSQIRLAAPHVIADGDIIKIGSYRIVARVELVGRTPAAPEGQRTEPQVGGWGAWSSSTTDTAHAQAGWDRPEPHPGDPGLGALSARWASHRVDKPAASPGAEAVAPRTPASAWSGPVPETPPIDFADLLKQEVENRSADKSEYRSSGMSVSELLSRRKEAGVDASGTSRTEQPGFYNHDQSLNSDILDVSAFAPSRVSTGREFIVQIFLHNPSQSKQVARMAKASDLQARSRGITTLNVDVSLGQRVEIILDSSSVILKDPAQYLIWRGSPRACQFAAIIPKSGAGRTFPIHVTVRIENIPVGHLRFNVMGVLEDNDPAVGEFLGDSTKRYKRAFLSYASGDRAEVLKRAQILNAMKIAFFQDILSLEPGERWEERIYAEIDACDLFLLFWSASAANSPWVEREAGRALRRWTETGGLSPEITPVILEGPPVPRPPDSLSAIHFNDSIRHVIAAIEAH